MTAEPEQRLRQRNEDLQREIQAETEKVEQAKLDLQRQIETATEEASRERAALKKKIAAEGERMVMAKKAAATFIVELEDRIQQQLSQLERIKQMDLSVQEDVEVKPVAEENHSAPEQISISAPELELPEIEEPPVHLSEIEMTKQIEENLSRILAESAKLDAAEKEQSAGDTRPISPVL